MADRRLQEGPVLILGGTSEARALAECLQRTGTPVLSSLAGRVQRPRLPVGEVRIGGFGGVDGLRRWIGEHRVRAIVDATHPFAITMTRNAARAATDTGVPLLRLRRSPWVADAGHRWTDVPDIAAAADEVRARGDRVFLTTGRQDVGAFADIGSAWFLIRVVDPPTSALPPHRELLQSRGPYRYQEELDLMRRHRIDRLVTKNSGGELTRAKLDAAATAGVDVIMVQRPHEPEAGQTVHSVSAAVEWVAART